MCKNVDFIWRCQCHLANIIECTRTLHRVSVRDNSYCLQYLDFLSAYDVFDVQLLLADLDHTFAKFASVRFSVIFVEKSWNSGDFGKKRHHWFQEKQSNLNTLQFRVTLQSKVLFKTWLRAADVWTGHTSLNLSLLILRFYFREKITDFLWLYFHHIYKDLMYKKIISGIEILRV